MLLIDKIKLTAAALILIGGIAAFYYLDGSSGLVRGASLAAGILVAFIVALLSGPGQAGRAFAQESYRELLKVVWPTRKETTQMTLVVIVLVIVLAVILWVLDWGLLQAVKALTGQRS